MAASSAGAALSSGATRFIRQSGSTSAQFALGGSSRRCSASTVISASMAPAAPSMWPCSALVELTRRASKSAPQTSASALRSTTSPMRVAVPWALQ
ncbi:hypothetical protein D3C72_1635350 [compost metagenome]